MRPGSGLCVCETRLGFSHFLSLTCFHPHCHVGSRRNSDFDKSKGILDRGFSPDFLGLPSRTTQSYTKVRKSWLLLWLWCHGVVLTGTFLKASHLLVWVPGGVMSQVGAGGLAGDGAKPAQMAGTGLLGTSSLYCDSTWLRDGEAGGKVEGRRRCSLSSPLCGIGGAQAGSGP